MSEEARERTNTLKLNSKPMKKRNMGLITGAPLNLDTSGMVYDPVAGLWVAKSGKENHELDMIEGFPNESMKGPDPDSWKGRAEYMIDNLRSKWDECQVKHKQEVGFWLSVLNDKNVTSPMSLSQVRTLALKKIIADANVLREAKKASSAQGIPLEFSISQLKRPSKPQTKLDFTGNEHLKGFSEEGEFDDDEFGIEDQHPKEHVKDAAQKEDDKSDQGEDSDFEVRTWVKDEEKEDFDQPEIEDDDLEGQPNMASLERFKAKIN